MIVHRMGAFGRPAYNLRRFPHLDGFGRPAYNLRRFPHLEGFGADDGFVIPVEMPVLAAIIKNDWARTNSDGLGGVKGATDEWEKVRAWVEELNNRPGAAEFENARSKVMAWVEDLKDKASQVAAMYEWDMATGRSKSRAEQLGDALQQFSNALYDRAPFQAYYDAVGNYVRRKDAEDDAAYKAALAKKAAEEAARVASEKSKSAAELQAKLAPYRARIAAAKMAAIEAQKKLEKLKKKAATKRVLGIPVVFAAPIGLGILALFLGGTMLQKRKA